MRQGWTVPILLLASLSGAGPAQEDLDRELPRLRPTQPADALATIRALPGFRVILRAAEPVVADPIAAAFDADGRLFVVEMGDYPFAENRPDGRVRELIDADGDGTYESSRIFLDGLPWPTGLAPYRDGWFVIAAPDLIFARDLDGDGAADDRRVVFTGFGTQNVQALANNLTWGPDGWIHGASGGNGGVISRPDRPEEPPITLSGGADFRFHPATGAFESTSGGGQFGLSFDDWGHKFVCSNSQHARQVAWPRQVVERNPAASVGETTPDIAIDGPAAPVFRISEPEPWRVVRTRRRAGDPSMLQRLPSTELSATGFFTSATGITVFRGTALGPEIEDNLFIGDVGGNLVHRKRLIPDAPAFRAARADEGVEFLASTDNWFRPANFANTPDGTLLVLDMYREAIEHPASIPDDIKARLDLRSGRDRGRVYEVVRPAVRRRDRPRLAEAATSRLVETLLDPDGWWRETARRLLVERADPEAPALIRAVLDREPPPRAVAALLTTLDAVGALGPDDLRPRLTHADPRVRELASRLAGRLASVESSLLEALALRAADADPAVVFQAAVAIGGSTAPEAVQALARFVDRPGDEPWLRRAVATGLKDRALTFFELIASRGALERPGSAPWIETVGELIGHEGRMQSMVDFLAQLQGQGDSIRTRIAVLALIEGRRRAGGGFAPETGGPLASALAELAVEARAVAADVNAPSDRRVEAIRLLAIGGAASILEDLEPRLGPEEPPAVQFEAVRAIVRSGGAAASRMVLAHWAGLGLGARREAIEALSRSPDGPALLLGALEDGVLAPGDFDRVRRAQLLASPDPAIRDRASALLNGDGVDRGAIVTRYRSSMPPAGSPERGRELVAKHCATCHEPQGGQPSLAPDLRTVAGRSPDDLLLHILDPNREVAPSMAVVQVATKDGRILTGVLARETDSGLVLRRAEGAADEVARRDIEAIRPTGLSLMPEGLEAELDPTAMADVIAYLRSR